MRLIDRVMSVGENAPQPDQLFVVDNVAQYYFLNEKDDWDIDSFPNIAPPFGHFFMEFRMPSKVIDSNGVTVVDGAWKDAEIGVMFMCRDLGGNREAYEDEIKTNQLLENREIEWKYNGEKWLVNGLILCKFKSLDRVIMPGYIFMLIDDKGACSKLPNGAWHMAFGDPVCAWVIDSAPGSIFFPMFLALSFLHCKNVNTERIVPPEPLSKKYQKRHGKPLETYHILNIEPMKRVLNKDGGAEKTGLKRALHICRGHFKDFSIGKGLFGKYKGLYWWDNHSRGDPMMGIADKDYRVNHPKRHGG